MFQKYNLSTWQITKQNWKLIILPCNSICQFWRNLHKTSSKRMKKTNMLKTNTGSPKSCYKWHWEVVHLLKTWQIVCSNNSSSYKNVKNELSFTFARHFQLALKHFEHRLSLLFHINGRLCIKSPCAFQFPKGKE